MTDIIKIDNLSAVADFSQYNKYTIEELTEIISTIEVKAFYMKGTLLKYIKDNKRYEELDFKSFDEYYKQVLNYKKAYAYQLLNAVDVYDNLSAVADFLPTAEKQLRPLTSLDKDSQVKVWQEVAKDKVPTAKEVQEAVNKQTNKVPKITKNTTKVDNNLLQEIEQLKQEIKKLESINIMLSSVVDEYVEKEKQWLNIKEEQVIDKGALKREVAFSFIQKHGSALQVLAITKQNPDNQRLYNLFDKVRQDYLQHSPPQSLTSDILDATHIIL